MTFNLSKEDYELINDMLLRELVDMQASDVDRETLAKYVRAYNHFWVIFN